MVWTFPSRLIVQVVTGKSITMLCNFPDLQAESSAVLSEADVRKRFNLACRGPSKLYLLCNNGQVQYFCRMREDTAKTCLDFYKHKICICLVKKVLLLIKKLSLPVARSFSHQNNFRFLGPNDHSIPLSHQTVSK